MDKLLGAVIGNLGPGQALLGPYRLVLSLSLPLSSSSPASAPPPAGLVGGKAFKLAHIDASGVSPGHLAESLGVLF